MSPQVKLTSRGLTTITAGVAGPGPVGTRQRHTMPRVPSEMVPQWTPGRRPDRHAYDEPRSSAAAFTNTGEPRKQGGWVSGTHAQPRAICQPASTFEFARSPIRSGALTMYASTPTENPLRSHRRLAGTRGGSAKRETVGSPTRVLEAPGRARCRVVEIVPARLCAGRRLPRC